MNSSIPVSNAGLVLLHPFIKPFFTQCSLLKEDQFIDKDSQLRAIVLLHYLAWENTDYKEEDLILNKVFCNVSLEAPITMKFIPTRSEIDEADEMISSVIKLWPALNNTAPASVRNIFLQRGGTLFVKDTGFGLRVETKSTDILLENIGWNFSIIKFPWMEKALSAEWV